MGELLVRRDGPIGTVTFSNPEKYNALSREMWLGIPEALAGFDSDPAIRVVVLEGAGEKAFVSGADISQFESNRSSGSAQAEYNAAVEAAYLAPIRCGKPVIAKIRGLCFGGGLGLAAACDVRICSSDSRFRMPAGRLGLGYGVTGVQRFVTIIGVQNTYDIFFSARIFDAADALRMGFVTRTIAPEQFDTEVGAWVDTVAENAPLTLRALKTTVKTLLVEPGKRDFNPVDAALAACFASEDYREGTRAFMEKRKPEFRGR